MRDPARIDRILGKLRAYWMTHPDLRLGQLVVNMASSGGADTFYVEDEPLERELTEVCVDQRLTTSGAPESDGDYDEY